MNYESYDIEWDETWNEMGKFSPEIGDKVLCLCPELAAGEVVEVKLRGQLPREIFFVVRLEDGSVDEFPEEYVLKRKEAEDAA